MFTQAIRLCASVAIKCKPFSGAILAMALLASPAAMTRAAIQNPSVEQLKVANTQSFTEMAAAVKVLLQIHTHAVKAQKPNHDLQQKILEKAGECITTVAPRYKNYRHLSKENQTAARRLHAELRAIILQIRDNNRETIADLQENMLDQLQDTTAFFKSPCWQRPQYLLTLSSYWLGWNGYYGSQTLAANDPQRSHLLKEAIKGFSRAFIDFKENGAIVSSLFGRGMCYSLLKAYERARKDLKSARMRMSRDNPLYFRCLYEDVRIIYRTGNYETAQRRLAKIAEDFPRDRIPEEIAASLDQIRSKVLIALLEKKGPASQQKQAMAADTPHRRFFRQAKQLAVNPAAVPAFYRYVRENWQSMEDMTFAELGPVGHMALGDVHFDKHRYARALHYYTPLWKDYPAFLSQYQDSVWFRSAYGHCRLKQWEKALIFLTPFHERFPDSPLAHQAADLYYAAANSHYETQPTGPAQKQFIHSIRTYIKQYPDQNPKLNKALFSLAKHYQKSGHLKKAAVEFALVTEDSPNWPAAQHHLLQYYVDALANQHAGGQNYAPETLAIYNRGLQLIKNYNAVVQKQTPSKTIKKMQPGMAILEAQLLMQGPNCDYEKVIKTLQHFETQRPIDTKIGLAALRLRLACYHRLNQMGKVQKELARFSVSPALQKDGHLLLRRIADTHYHQGFQLHKQAPSSADNPHWNTALLVFQKIMHISKDSPKLQDHFESTQLRMASIYIEQNRLEPAEALYREILAKNSLSADAIYNLGLLYEKQQKWDQALETWRQFTDGVEAGSYHWFEARYKTAVTFTHLGNPQKACDILTITLVLHPDFGENALKDKYLDLKSKACQ